jgi:hypothetical protein
VLREEEYGRLQAAFLAMVKQSDRPQERARWLALVQACHEGSLTTETRSKPETRWQRAAA